MWRKNGAGLRNGSQRTVAPLQHGRGLLLRKCSLCRRGLWSMRNRSIKKSTVGACLTGSRKLRRRLTQRILLRDSLIRVGRHLIWLFRQIILLLTWQGVLLWNCKRWSWQLGKWMKMATGHCILCMGSRNRETYVSWVEIVFAMKFGINNTRTWFRTSVLWIWFQIQLKKEEVFF